MKSYETHDKRDTETDMYFTSPYAIVHKGVLENALSMAKRAGKKRVIFTFGELTTVKFTIIL